MAAPQHFDVWFVAADTVYRGVPYGVVTGWAEQGRDIVGAGFVELRTSRQQRRQQGRALVVAGVAVGAPGCGLKAGYLGQRVAAAAKQQRQQAQASWPSQGG